VTVVFGAVVGFGAGMEQLPSAQNSTEPTVSTGPSRITVAELLHPMAGQGVLETEQPAVPEVTIRINGTRNSTLFMDS
jgi:hypothetical protein